MQHTFEYTRTHRRYHMNRHADISFILCVYLCSTMMTQSMNYLTSDGETSSASKINPNARQPQEEEDDEDWC